MAEIRKRPRQQKLTPEEVIPTNRWYLERVRVKRMLHELGRCMEEVKAQ